MKRPPKLTPQLKETAMQLLAAIIAEQETDEKVTTYEKAILAETPYCVRPDYPDAGARILDPELAYNMSDDDFLRYEAQCQAAHIANGFYTNGETCPRLMAQEDRRQARRNFINAGAYLTGGQLTYDRITLLEDYQKVEDTLMGLVLALFKPPQENVLAKCVMLKARYEIKARDMVNEAAKDLN